MQRTVAVAAVALSAVIAISVAQAQAQQPAKKSPTAATPVQPVPATQPPAAQPIALDQALYLIRSTLLTLNDANHSGNYSVLRDLAAPSFQAKNSAADLALIFNDLRKRNFDLYGAALLAPQLSAAPSIDAKVLRLTGAFPTRPLMIAFDLMYETSNGQWKLLGISISTPQVPASAPVASIAPTKPK